MWRRWGTPPNFFLAFTDELKKQIIIKKTVEVGQSKILIFMMYLKKKKRKKKNTCRYDDDDELFLWYGWPTKGISFWYHYQNLDDVIYMGYSSWYVEQNILKLANLDHLLPFYPHKNPKIKILKNEKNCCSNHHFTHVYQKSQPYDVQLLRYRVRQEEFSVILGHFLPFQPAFQNLKIKKTPL